MQWFLRFRVCIIICMAVLLITAAVLFSAVRAVLPYATGYKQEIQQAISEQVGLPVEIGSINAEIYWFTPRLVLNGVTVYDEQHLSTLFNFKEAFVSLDVMSTIQRREIIVDDVGLVQADISIEKLSDSEWLIQGIKVTSDGKSELPEQLIYMINNSDYLLRDSNIFYQDHTGDKLNLKLLDVNVEVQNSFDFHDIRLSMQLPTAYGEYLAVAANLHGDLDALNGDIYVEAKQIHIDQWQQKFNLLEGYLAEASVDVDLWATLKQGDIESLQTQFSAEHVNIKNKHSKKSWRSHSLSSKVRYNRNGEYWDVAVSDLSFGDGLRPDWGESVNVLASYDEDTYYFSADMLRISELIKIAEVVANDKQSKDLDALGAYKIRTDLYNINLQLAQNFSTDDILKSLTLEAMVYDLSLIDSKNNIKLEGVDALVSIEQQKIAIEMLTKDAVLELDKLFREPIFVSSLSGRLLLEKDENTWLLSSDRLQLKNKHINTFSRLDIQLPEDGKLYVDAQINFYDAYGKYVHHYLPVGVMTAELVDWLDMAVTDGFIAEGTMVLQGRLEDFPFDKHNGSFQVLFSPEKVKMQFLENWPVLEDASATVKFNNKSLVVSNARGRTLGTTLFNGYAEIPELPDPVLLVRTDASSSNEDVQSYVWQSPLDDVLGDALRLFQVEGESELALKLDVPLNAEEIDVKIDGQLTLINTDFYYPVLGYEVRDINGVIDFTEKTIFADTVKAKVQNNTVLISAFTRPGDSGLEVIFHLDGLIEADYLLQRYDWIPKHWLSGRSHWSIDIAVPNNVKDYLVQIKTSSYLENTIIDVSDKVSKTKKTQLPFTTEIDVLPGDGLYLKTILKDNAESKTADVTNLKDEVVEHQEASEATEIINLFAVRDDKNIWKIDIKSAYMKGKGEFTEGLSSDTLIDLDLDSINISALFYSESKQGSEPMQPAAFPSLSLKTKKVIWKDWVFNDVYVSTSRHEKGMLINDISFTGHAMKFNAQGTWLTKWRGGHETALRGTVSSENIGTTLSGLGFHQSIDRANFSASFTSKWPSEPYGLSWENMKGETAFELKNGEILEVDPGTGGRLLGLLNIFRLTNRLAFDFNDVYRKGYSFDTITGEFEFLNGKGSMKKFEVSAAAADISMFGSIGMVKQDYGLQVRVKPHTSSLTFAGGVLLGGVAVGAGLALIQKVFDINIIGHNVYSITGSWDDPVIEKIVEVYDDEDEDF